MSDPVFPVSDTPTSPGIVGDLGLDHWIEGDESHGRAAVVPALYVPHTEFVRIGVLMQLADVIAGQPPAGAITPTTDISVHITNLRPMESVHLVARSLKTGRLLAVFETLMMADDEEEPFAHSLSMFMNWSTPVGIKPPKRPPLEQPLAERIGARVLSPGLVELAPHAEVANDRHGTILGGVVAMLAELAAESLYAEVSPVVVTDLDVRFLNRVKVGPLWARARRFGADGDGDYLVVEMEDVGDDARPIAYATAQVRPLP
jgi:acyl-coenzyme A thioesterase PaaI-like protein